MHLPSADPECRFPKNWRCRPRSWKIVIQSFQTHARRTAAASLLVKNDHRMTRQRASRILHTKWAGMGNPYVACSCTHCQVHTNVLGHVVFVNPCSLHGPNTVKLYHLMTATKARYNKESCQGKEFGWGCVNDALQRLLPLQTLQLSFGRMQLIQK